MTINCCFSFDNEILSIFPIMLARRGNIFFINLLNSKINRKYPVEAQDFELELWKS